MPRDADVHQTQTDQENEKKDIYIQSPVLFMMDTKEQQQNAEGYQMTPSLKRSRKRKRDGQDPLLEKAEQQQNAEGHQKDTKPKEIKKKKKRWPRPFAREGRRAAECRGTPKDTKPKEIKGKKRGGQDPSPEKAE